MARWPLGRVQGRCGGCPTAHAARLQPEEQARPGTEGLRAPNQCLPEAFTTQSLHTIPTHIHLRHLQAAPSPSTPHTRMHTSTTWYTRLGLVLLP